MYEVYTGVDALDARSGILEERLLLRTNNEFIAKREYASTCKQAKKLSTNTVKKRYYTYIVQIFPEQPMENPKINGCISKTIFETSYIEGELIL